MLITSWTFGLYSGKLMIDGNIWSASFQVCRVVLQMVLLYVVGVVAITAFSEYRGSTSSMFGVQIVVVALLAIPAHLVMLSRYDPATFNTGLKKWLWPFLWRSTVLGLVAGLPALIVLFWALGSEMDRGSAILLFLAILLPSASIVFSLFGTMLPAAVVGDDASFGAAFRRASQSFSYALPRLLIVFGLLSIIQFVGVILITAALPSEGMIFPPSGGIDLLALLLVTIANVIGAYQVVMTAVILSRSYLRSREAVPSQPA